MVRVGQISLPKSEAQGCEQLKAVNPCGSCQLQRRGLFTNIEPSTYSLVSSVRSGLFVDIAPSTNPVLSSVRSDLFVENAPP
jgi:hypothetical protein